MLRKPCLSFPSQFQVLLRDPLLSLAWNKKHSHSPAFESSYSAEHITHFTLLDPTPLLSLNKVQALSPIICFLICFSTVACAKPPCGNFDLENCLHGGHKTEQIAYALLCLIDVVVFFCLFPRHRQQVKLQQGQGSFPLEQDKKKFYLPLLCSTSNNIVTRTRKDRMTGNRTQPQEFSGTT